MAQKIVYHELVFVSTVHLDTLEVRLAPVNRAMVFRALCPWLYVRRCAND